MRPLLEERIVASEVFAFLARLGQATARLVFAFAAGTAPSLAAFPETSGTQFLGFSSSMFEVERARLFLTRLFCLSLLVSTRSSHDPPLQIGMSRSAINPMVDVAVLIIPGTCWRISVAIPSG